MNPGREQGWNDLSAIWRGQRAPPGLQARLRSRVRRQSALMRIVALGEAAVLAAFALFTAVMASRGVSTAEGVLLAALWTVALSAEVLSLLNRRGSWRAAAETTPAFVELTERRARAKVRAAWIVGALALVQASLVVGLVVAGGGAAGATIRLGAGVAAGYVGWAIWYGRRARAELDEMAEVRVFQHPTGDQPDVV